MSPTDPLVWTIRGYQRLISRYTPPVCRFHPSCSHYALEALQVHGVLRGSGLAAWRILRCSPLFPGGYDPVPALPGAPTSPVPPAFEHSGDSLDQ
jgi:putative membrane protein insertion efficiency factor